MSQGIELPFDMLQEIFSKNLSLMKEGNKLNKGVRQRLNPQLNKFCAEPLTKNEIIDSLFNNDGPFMILAPFDPEFQFLNIYQRRSDNEYSRNRITAQSHQFGQTGQIEVMQYPQDVITPDRILVNMNQPNRYVDVYTIFDVYLQRQGCNTQEPRYAYNKTRALFHQNLDLISKNAVFDRLSVYLYLMGNMQLLGIPFKFINLPKFVSGNEHIFDVKYLDIIDRDIPIMTKLIDQEIDNL